MHPFALFLFGFSLHPVPESCLPAVSSSSSSTAAVPVTATSLSSLSASETAGGEGGEGDLGYQNSGIAELFCGAVGWFCSDSMTKYI